MKINTKIRYGLRAMIEIGQENNTKGVLQKEIAEHQDIPLNYLDSIITGLRNAGLIINFAGRGGGYILAKRAEQISVYDVYRAFEPELNLVQCSCETNECHRSGTCPAQDYWYRLNSIVKETMMSHKLSDLLQFHVSNHSNKTNIYY